MYYGLSSQHHAADIAIAICECLGFGRTGHGVEMLLETCATETGLGSIQDSHPLKLGVGLSQVDQGTFDWLKNKYKSGAKAEALFERFGIKLAYVKYRELAYSPLLAMVFCRLRYMTVTAPIPKTRTERASYWKVHYNSSEGKGTIAHYLKMCEHTLDTLLSINLTVNK
jgi:hypothetical protein